MVRVKTSRMARVVQGDIYRDVVHIESIEEQRGEITITRIVYPLAIVLTQDCDLEQDYRVRWSRVRVPNQDKQLVSVLMAPIYNADHVFAGEHLLDLELTMGLINKNGSPGNNLIKNQNPRYHYMEFPKQISIAPSVIDFKHYFTSQVAYLKKARNQFVCRVGELYRVDISHRFASFLARIGLPGDNRGKMPSK